jgi:MFS family permease
MESRQPPPEQASEDVTSRRSKIRLLLSLHLPAVVMGLGTGGTAVAIPAVAQSFEVGVGVATLLFISQMIGATLAPLPTGLLADKIGRRKIVLAGPVVIAVAALLTAFAIGFGTFAMVLAARFLAGFGQQMWMVSRITVIADSASSSSRGRQITSMFGVQRFGSLGGPIIGGFLAVQIGLSAPFVLQAVMAFISIIPSYFLLRETLPSQERAGRGSRSDARTSKEILPYKAFLTRPILSLFTVQYLTNVTRGGIQNGSVLLLFAAYQFGVDPLELGLLRGAMAPAGIPFTFFAGYVMDRFGRKWSIVPGQTAMFISMAFMATIAFANLDWWMFVAAFVLSHLSISMLSGNMQTMGSDIAPEGARGRYFGVSRMVSETGSLSSPVSFAIFNALASFGAAFIFMAGTAFAAGTIVTFVLKETLQRGTREASPPILGEVKPPVSDGGQLPTADEPPPEVKEDASAGERT